MLSDSSLLAWSYLIAILGTPLFVLGIAIKDYYFLNNVLISKLNNVQKDVVTISLVSVGSFMMVFGAVVFAYVVGCAAFP